jgi:hypothetical protein
MKTLPWFLIIIILCKVNADCTPNANDPYASGSFVECCVNTTLCFDYDNYYYRCDDDCPTTLMPSVSPTTSVPTKQPTEECSEVGIDPFSTGRYNPCCNDIADLCFNYNSNTYICVAKGQCQSALPPTTESFCATQDEDPNLANKPCCDGLNTCDVEQNGRSYQLCKADCSSSGLLPTPDDAPCADNYEDPYQFGYKQQCCRGMVECLSNWAGDCRFYSLCVNSNDCWEYRRLEGEEEAEELPCAGAGTRIRVSKGFSNKYSMKILFMSLVFYSFFKA